MESRHKNTIAIVANNRYVTSIELDLRMNDSTICSGSCTTYRELSVSDIGASCDKRSHDAFLHQVSFVSLCLVRRVAKQ